MVALCRKSIRPESRPISGPFQALAMGRLPTQKSARPIRQVPCGEAQSLGVSGAVGCFVGTLLPCDVPRW